ncbi:MAG: DUF2264 domain-containing protein [Acidimicrobiales bacterium]|jgi:hypothetical protein|nr:DUF2264 domain-containing protein [Acidimicrobiales bacterium]
MPDPRANPLAGNPLATRDDVQQAVRDLVEPILPHLSPGGARARLGSGAALFPQRVAELEGYARPLYGIVPLVAGGGRFDHWDRWCEGLANGTDPSHPEYWGPVAGDTDQRMVEMAAIGWAMAAVPAHYWEPLDDPARERVLAWLDGIDRFDPAPNNWQFFRLLVHLGRERVGAPGDAAAAERSTGMIEDYHLGDGWYRDGMTGNVDWYLPFAFHTYGLMIAASGLGDREAADRYVQRARGFAPDFAEWFAPDGASFAYGRSQTYRFAQGSMWGALAAADVEALPWDRVRGLSLRHLRWWSQQAISDRDGVLSIGYAYDNRRLAEGYNSAGSPYWAMKAFGALAAPADHPFWTADEAPQPPLSAPVDQPHGGFVVDRDDDHVVVLSGRRSPTFAFLEQNAAKYGKLAYSSRFGFCGEVEFPYADLGTDSTVRVSDGEATHTRWNVQDAFVEDGMVWSRWRPFDDVVIDTVLCGGAPWHHRVHLVRTDRALTVADSGFAVATDSLRFGSDLADEQGDGRVLLRTGDAASGIRGDGEGSARPLPPNAGTTFPHTAIPVLTSTLEPGEHLLRRSVLGTGDQTGTAWDEPPTIPEAAVELLERERDRVVEAPATDPQVDLFRRRRSAGD